VLYVSPCRDHRAQNHQTEAEKLHRGHAAAEPEDFAVGDEDDGQIFEDGVHGDGEKLKGFGRGVDHADEQ